MRIVIIFLGILNIIAGLALIAVFLFFFICGIMLLCGAGSAAVGATSTIWSFLYLLSGAVLLYAGYGFLLRRNRARIVAIIALAITVPFLANWALESLGKTPYLLLCFFYLLILNLPSTKSYFRALQK